MVERANKEVNRHFRAIVFDRKIKSNWSLTLPLVQRVMNTTVHSSTGVASAQIIFGNAIKKYFLFFYRTLLELSNYCSYKV